MPSCLSALEKALNDLLQGREEQGGRSPSDLLFGRLRVGDLRGVHLVDHALCNFLHFMQTPHAPEGCEEVLRKLTALSFNTAPIQGELKESDSEVAKKFSEAYFIPATRHKKSGKSFSDIIDESLAEDSWEYAENSPETVFLKRMQKDINFYEQLVSDATHTEADQEYMLQAFKKLIPLWVAKQDCWKEWEYVTLDEFVSRYHAHLVQKRKDELFENRKKELVGVEGADRLLDEYTRGELIESLHEFKRSEGCLRQIKLMIDQMRECWELEDEQRIPVIKTKDSACNFFGSRLWDPLWWYEDELFVACADGEDLWELEYWFDAEGLGSDYPSLLAYLCNIFQQNYPQNTDLISDYRRCTNEERSQYLNCAERSVRAGNSNWIVDEGLRAKLRESTIEELYWDFESLKLPDVVIHKANMLFNIYIASLIGVGRSLRFNEDKTTSTTSDFLPRMTNEPLGAGCLPVGITCSDQADEKPVTPIRLSFPDKPLAGRRPEWPIPLQLFGCFYEPDSWLGLEEGLLKSVDRFFSPIWSESCLGRRIETRVDGFFGTSERYKFIDKAFQDAVKRRKPLYRNAQGILSKEKKEGFAPVRDNSEEYMDILAEALKAHFTRQFSPQVGESCEGYYAWHRQGLLVKSTANRELNPDKTVVLFVERACDEFIEEFGLDKLKLKRDIQKNLYKGSGSELSQFYNQEVIALKDLTGDWHRDTKIVEQSLLLQDMVVSIESFCGPIAACDETSKGLYFAKIWSLLASCLSAWAKESAKTLDCDLLKGFVHKALGAFREQESAAFFAMGPGLSTKRVISTRHFALYLDAEEDRPLVIRSYDSHTGILVIRAEADKAYLLVNSPSEKKVKDLLRRYEKPHYAQTCEWVESNKLRVHRGDVIVVAGCARVEIR